MGRKWVLNPLLSDAVLKAAPHFAALSCTLEGDLAHPECGDLEPLLPAPPLLKLQQGLPSSTPAWVNMKKMEESRAFQPFLCHDPNIK